NLLRRRSRRGAQCLQRTALRIVGCDDPRDLVERQVLKPGRLLHAAPDQPIYDGTKTAVGLGTRRLFHLGDTIASPIIPVMTVTVNAMEVPPVPSPSFGARRDQAHAQRQHEQHMHNPGSGHGGVLTLTKRRNAPPVGGVPERTGLPEAQGPETWCDSST